MLRDGVAVAPLVIDNAVRGCPGSEICLPEGGGDICVPLEGRATVVKEIVVRLLECQPNCGKNTKPGKMPTSVLFDAKAMFDVGIWM